MAGSIRECSRAMVLPAQPTTPHPFFLSCLDLFWQDVHYNRRLIFYPTPLSHPDGLSPQEESLAAPDIKQAAALMEKLKSSLALCLVHYYPWCGRLSKSAEPPHRPFINCCDAGVEFVEASSSLPLSHLAGNGFQMKPLFQQLCQQPDHMGDCLFSSPLLSIQATLFSDGGLVLGIAQSHVVADGQSLWDFMVSWGECARGVPLSLPPLHDRKILAVPDPSPDKATWSLNLHTSKADKEEEERYAGKASSPTRTENMDSASAGASKADDSHVGVDSLHSEDNANRAEMEQGKEGNAGTNAAASGGHMSEPLVQCTFELSAAAVKRLKSEAGGGHTSFEVICAHLWKHFAAARENAASEPTYLFAPVNVRKRMTPPIPPSYFGNVIGFDVIVTTEGAIRRETLCATACRVHEIVARVKEDYMIAFMHWLETHNFSLVGVWASANLGKGVNTASSPWFPAYQVDFGWGKPVAVRSAKVEGDGEVVLFGGRPGSARGDVEICTALPERVLRRLLEDPAFLAIPPSSPFG